MRKQILTHLFLTASVLVFFFIITNLAFAEKKDFIEEYTYQASEYDSKVSCRALALEQVKLLLLEKLGIYLETETEVKNFQLTKDQIKTFTAGIVSAVPLVEIFDGKTFYLKAKVTADPKEVFNSIEKLRQDRQKTKELEETRNRANELIREVEGLRKKLALAKKDQTKIARYDEAIKELRPQTGLIAAQQGNLHGTIELLRGGNGAAEERRSHLTRGDTCFSGSLWLS